MIRFAPLFFAAVSTLALADIQFRNWDDPDAPKWEEEYTRLPGLPDEAQLIEFTVSAAASNRFFIDGRSIEPGKDGVIRYTLVVKTAGGATNITHEGIRCQTREVRIYATGRTDGSWGRARLSEWRPIENKTVNRHHAALLRDFFCPGGIPIYDAEEGRNALRLGRHPDVPQAR